MSISPTLGGKLLSIPVNSPVKHGGGVVGGVDRCISLWYIVRLYVKFAMGKLHSETGIWCSSNHYDQIVQAIAIYN